MNPPTTLLAAIAAIAVSGPPLHSPAAEPAAEYDIVVYGGTSAGVTAAVQAQRMGKSTVIVGPDVHLGGLSSSGLGFTDTGNKAVIGGLAREFYQGIYNHYQEDEAWNWQSRAEYGNKGQGTPAIDGNLRTMYIFEPHAAERVFKDFVNGHSIPVFRDEWLDREDGVAMADGKVTAITMLSGKTFKGKVFIDATYEGDLMAAAGVDYHVGREASDVYGETWNGVQIGVLHHSHWFNGDIDPYVVPGDPSSGLLPRISADDPGEKGAGDHRVQAYCYRMCLTNVDENRIPFARPDGYDPDQYALLVRVLESGWNEVFGKFDPIPNHKTDTNNHGPFSTDNIGYNYDYPEASYDERRAILAEHQTYQKGLMYFYANDERVPAPIRERMSQWGLPKDEFTDNGGWPHQIYVREARRLVGEYVMTEQDCLDQRPTPDSVGMGSYTLDSHNVQRYVKPDGFVQNEGDIGVHAPRPYEIAFGALVPKKAQCENLLVPVCVSSSHIAFGSIRMEPVFMILGQSAATAAALAIDAGTAVQDVPYDQLQKRLEADGQMLAYAAAGSVKAADLKGIVIDDENATLDGKWEPSSSRQPFVGNGYRHDGALADGRATAVFKTELDPGTYEIRLAYSPDGNRASNVPVTIGHASGEAEVSVDQSKAPEHDGLTTTLGKFTFDGTATITVSNNGTDGHVIIDAVQLLPVE
ncbi:FAD-dependent oxidoreductase [soil metagenome]